jgi:putative glycerol-1-phosphate prenyltransferase
LQHKGVVFGGGSRLKADFRQWKHVFKLDPEREISDEALEKICLSATDAVMVGGSTGVTFDNTLDLLSRIRRYAVPCVLEVSAREGIMPGFDFYFIPVVLNTHKAEWLIGRHYRTLRELGTKLPWEAVAAEGYIILNGQSTVAQMTGADADLDARGVIAYAALAENLFSLPIVYIECSGVFGDMDLVRNVRDSLRHARLFYGGGIDSPEKAVQALGSAHTIIVGNVIYDDLDRALDTVRAVKQMSGENAGGS